MSAVKKLIIFDFDGTLADTLPIGYEMYQEAAEKYHLKKFTDYQEFSDFLQLSLPQMLFRLRVSPFLFRQIVKEQLTSNSRRILNAALFPGIVDVIKALAKQYSLMVVSSSFASVIQEYLKKHQLQEHFSEVIGTETHKDKKVKIKMCLQKMQCSANEAILIGDSTRDMKDGKQLGLTTIAVAYGVHPLNYLQREKPDAIAQIPEDILKAVVALSS